MYAVDVRSGEEVWNARSSGTIYSQPAIAGDVAYFGSGDGPSSLLRWPLKIAIRAGRRILGWRTLATARDNGPTDEGERATHRWTPVLRALWALALAVEKRSKMRASIKARNRGMVVLCDRYPQIQVMGFNDGPLLSHWVQSRSQLMRRLARWEHGQYECALACPPDLAIKLDVPSEVAISRKPEISVAESQRKRDAMQRIHYGSTCQEFVIDSTQPLERVLLQVKSAVWKQL